MSGQDDIIESAALKLAGIYEREQQRQFLYEIDYGNIDTVKNYLLDGLNPNFAAHVATVMYGHPLAELAICNQAHDNEPRTPLMIATNPHLESYTLIQELLYHKADPNYSDDSGSVLHWAIYQDPFIVCGIPYASESLRLLLERGANPFIRNEEGETAYDVCINDPQGTNSSNTQILKEFMDLIRIQRCYRRKMTRKRVKTIKCDRKLALLKCMESREGVLGTIRYDPSLLERISKFI